MPEHSTTTADERQRLIELAMLAIRATVEGTSMPAPQLDLLPERLRQPAATFVTLSCESVLRGCMGTTVPHLPLAEDVVERARSAASLDPRFPAIQPDELDLLQIEVSILTPPVVVDYSTAQELLAALDPGRHGVIIQKGMHRATFLPQVWLRVNDAQIFLELLCQKASLHRDAWKTDPIRVETYLVESFHNRL